MEVQMMQIATVFSKFPAGRYKEDGPFNGARFRDEFLIPAVQRAAAEHSKVVVLLDGVVAYSSSFLEEAFGGLARAKILSPDLLRKSIEIRADDLAYRPAKEDADHYLNDELQRLK